MDPPFMPLQSARVTYNENTPEDKREKRKCKRDPPFGSGTDRFCTFPFASCKRVGEGRDLPNFR